MNIKRIKNYHITPTITGEEDNTIVDGYLTPSMLYKEMSQGGRVAIDYIEKLKENMSQADSQALYEQINSDEFQAQLQKASKISKEKVEIMFEKSQAEARLRDKLKDFKDKQAKYIASYEKAQKELEKIKEYEKGVKHGQNSTNK